jgi:hypothetical protein
MRGGTEAITGSKAPLFGIALGAVSCNFKKELKPYESYEMWTRIVSWDEKWIWIVTHFVRKDATRPKSYTLYPEQTDSEELNKGSKFDPKSGMCASALSKCVFKQGRKTVSPEFMLRASGLLPVATEESDGTAPDSKLDTLNSEWTQERIEEERLRGMKIADLLGTEAQTALEQEFTAESEALGRHTDGTGITGVLSTLAQLAHVKRTQIL